MSDTTPRPDETPSDPTAPPTPPESVTPPPPAPEPATAEQPCPQQTYAPPQPVQPAQPAQPQYAQPGYAQPGNTQQLPPAYPPPGTAVAGPNPMSPTEERTWGMLSHAIAAGAMVLSAGFLSFVAALVIYLVNKDRGPFVRAHSANSLNVQIAAGIGFIIGWLLTITLIGAIIGIPILIAVFVWAVIVHIIGAVKANNGEWWTPPMTPQFVK